MIVEIHEIPEISPIQGQDRPGAAFYLMPAELQSRPPCHRELTSDRGEGARDGAPGWNVLQPGPGYAAAIASAARNAIVALISPPT
jgi:hypothetical protein